MNALMEIANGFLWGLGFALAFLLLHAINLAPRICS